MRALTAALLVLLLGCSAPETTRRAGPEISLPPMRTFATPSPVAPSYSNAAIARDFLDLTFQLENGDRLETFSRFEGPIKVRVLGAAPPTLVPDLDRLLGRFRREAGLDIRRVTEGEASVTVEVVRRAQIRRVAPSAACFVRPNVSSWAEYRRRRNDPATFWNRLVERRSIAVFIPGDVSPQEIRDCLHEEIAQGLGPVNDLYRLSSSVFNDDNFNTVLTGFDMLILRTTYDGALRSGMSRQQVAVRVPEILARLNPRGGAAGIAPPAIQLGAWNNAIAEATAPRTSNPRRLAAAQRAVELARPAGGNDPRLAFSYYMLGRLSLSTNPEGALRAFLTAGTIYQSRPDSGIQEAHVALQVAAFQLSAGRAEVAMQLVDQNLATVRRAEHAALLSLMLMVKAEALELRGQSSEAAQVQREALAWARYGIGDAATIRDRADEILAISPRSRTDGATPS